MTNAKIAFLFPHAADKTLSAGARSPLLAFDFDEFPAVYDMDISVFFVGMVDKQPYYLSAQMYRCGETTDTSVSPKAGMWIRAKDTQGKPDDIAASVDLKIENCHFDTDGTYYIETELSYEKKVIHSNSAYFKVSKTYG
ncbi:hypothetical protein LT980_07085 [Citrobacter portucalensis]|uniref:hypothetical protein n=1 Tax=Citrobacter portucalensis TaxID=1639133 RepID=UPI00202CD45E|nr:hypothetical protein [Citrobacter portucalensis]URR14349.1 hypothetical protein LT980_07085 [Citrobacter portucalensis]